MKIYFKSDKYNKNNIIQETKLFILTQLVPFLSKEHIIMLNITR